MEKTIILLKPDAIQRELVGEIITRIERKGLKIIGMKMMQLNDEILDEHYAHLADLPFFEEIKAFMKSSPIICLCVEGVDAIETVRNITGITLSRKAQVGTIRGDFGMGIQSNLVHTSDNLENATLEIKRFFEYNEIFSYEKLLERLIYSSQELEKG